MSVLMSLAGAHGPKPLAFNGLYYATIAMLIPVLFLAIAIQSNLFRDLIEASARSAERNRASRLYPHRAVLLLSLCFLIVIYGGAGEIGAISALLRQHDGFWQQWISQPAAIVLTVVAAAGPARVLLKAASDIATKGGTVNWLGKPKASLAEEPQESQVGPPADAPGESPSQKDQATDRDNGSSPRPPPTSA